MPKPIPDPLPRYVYPPIGKDVHSYFQDAKLHPFRHDASALELVNVWWLAEAALVAYADPQLAGEAFRDAGMELAGDQPIRGKSTECYVAHSDDFVIVAFRGTQVFRPDQDRTLGALQAALRDVVSDARFPLVELAGGGLVHSGFKAALDEIWDPLGKYLEQLRKERPNRTVWFTGHSLGGALATIAATRYPGLRGLYTFGSPLVGDAEFAKRLKVPVYRFVNNNDLVTRVPKIGRYQHVGEMKYIESSGRIGSSRSWSDGVRGIAANLWAGLRKIGSDGWMTRQPLDSFNDHGPLYYALHLWNCYESSRPKDLTGPPLP